MTSENGGQQIFRPVTVAPKGTPCGWTAYGETGTRLTCHGPGMAVHILTKTLPVASEGTALCAFHSPFDPTEAEREAVGQPMRTHRDVEAERLAARKAEAIKAHRLSAPMVGVLTEVGQVRGLVGAWAMRHVVVRGVSGATMRTVSALIARGILADEVNDGNQSGTGGFHDYVLTERGREVARALGVLAADLPTVGEVIDIVAGIHTAEDCATGCEVIIARGTAMLPAGGDVCWGCGTIFTRPTGQLHPALDRISAAVVLRNQANGGI